MRVRPIGGVTDIKQALHTAERCHHLRGVVPVRTQPGIRRPADTWQLRMQTEPSSWVLATSYSSRVQDRRCCARRASTVGTVSDSVSKVETYIDADGYGLPAAG